MINTPTHENLLRVAHPRECNNATPGNNREINATAPATATQHGGLKALSLKALACNNARNKEATEPQGCTQQSEVRKWLLGLAADELLPATIVHSLPVDELAACVGCTESELRAYLRALDKSSNMDAGHVPPDYTQLSHCEGCGPVWLGKGVPAHVIACPWCFRRKAGKTIPRPPIVCGDCLHRIPDSINPEGGMGSCRISANRWHWPMQSHVCGDYRVIDKREE